MFSYATFDGTICFSYACLEPRLAKFLKPRFINLELLFVNASARIPQMEIILFKTNVSVRLESGPKIAVVGAGPAGFYAAQHIAKEYKFIIKHIFN